MGGGVDDAVALGPVEVPAGRAALPRGHAAHVSRGQVHHVLLIASPRRQRGLEDDPPAVGAEVGLGVLSPEGELADVGHVPLARERGVGPAGPDHEAGAGAAFIERIDRRFARRGRRFGMRRGRGGRSR